jgi:hypothetical protein
LQLYHVLENLQVKRDLFECLATVGNTAKDICIFARQLGLISCFTPVKSKRCADHTVLA